MSLQRRLRRSTWGRLPWAAGAWYCCRVWDVESHHSQETAQRQATPESLQRIVRILPSIHQYLGLSVPIRSKPKEPPPPYPPPPAFFPLTYGKLDDQIGLLKPYYQSRFTTRSSGPGQGMAGKSGAPQSLPAPQLAGTSVHDVSGSSEANAEVPISPDLILPDDPPNPLQVKMGPLGQIMRPSTTSGSGKKKVKPASTPGPGQAAQGGGGSSAAPPGAGPDTPASVDSSPKKKKGNAGVGTGNGRKKKAEGQSDMAQSPVPPPVGFNQSQSRPGQGKGVVFPAVVVASA